MDQVIEIKKECLRLLNGELPLDVIDSYWCILNSAFVIIGDKDSSSYSSPSMHDSQLLFQMTSLKCLGLARLYEGYDYQNPYDKVKFKHTVDPSAMYPIVRAQFEAFCNFSNIYSMHSDDESKLLYLLWVISGLKFRGEHTPLTEESNSKLQEEKILIDESIALIKKMSIYVNADATEKGKIDNAIKSKEWKYKFDNGKFVFQSWKQLFLNTGVKPIIAESLYSFLSLWTHPSNVSVFQFKDMFDQDEHYSSGLHALNISRNIMAMLISDYCLKYDTAKVAFERLPVNAQILNNLINGAFRSENHYINTIQNSY